MKRPLNKREVDILEERGHWEASSSLHRLIKRLVRKKLPLEIRYIKDAHKTIFDVAKQPEIGGKYGNDNGPELKRIDGTILPMTNWILIPTAMAELDLELRERTKDLIHPKTEEEYSDLIILATKLSHKLACIHPFRNGNGRSSRLLLNSILLRAGLSEIAIKKSKSTYLRAMRQADDGDFYLLEKIVVDGLIEVKKINYSSIH